MSPAQAGELFRANGYDVPADRVEALLEYERLLLDWNSKINLVSRRDTSDFFIRHIVGSISFLFIYSLAEKTTLLDVGTGGGLPGVPLAILHPGIRVTMVDSIQKKVKAVDAIIRDLRLENAGVECARVEELSSRPVRPGGRPGKFDYIVARAVSSSARILGWCGPMLARGGRHTPGAEGHPGTPGRRTAIPEGSFILLKGGDLTAELASVGEAAGGASVSVRALEVAGSGDLLTEKKVIIISP